MSWPHTGLFEEETKPVLSAFIYQPQLCGSSWPKIVEQLM